MGMSIPYERSGRTRQKARTRAALITATRELIAEGRTPTVEDAAARGAISRTAAYRYFPNQRALLIAAHPEIDRKSLLGSNPPRDPAARLGAVIEEFLRITVETERQLRVALRLSLDSGHDQPDSSLRRGRAILWIEDALAPLAGQLSKQEVRRLVLAIRSAAGIEALVWLTDVAHLSRGQAVEVMKWSAQALLRSALADRKRMRPAKRPVIR
jgi:AcrR family transcriptional regulator